MCNSVNSKWDEFFDYLHYVDDKEREMLPHERKELLRLTTVIMDAILAEPESNIYDKKGDKR